MTVFQQIYKTIIEKYKDLFITKVSRLKIGNIHFKSSTTKHSMTASCTMELSSATEKKKEEINEELNNIVKQYFNTPEKLIQYLKTRGCIVYRIDNADKILEKIGEEEGFLTPLKGLKALFLNIILSILSGKKVNLNLRTKEMFVFNTNNTEIYTIARAVYKYYGYKHNLPGYDYESQELFKKIYTKRRHSSPFDGCSIEEMYACKEAIARDMESINFTIALSVEYENAKKAAIKIASESGASI